jgi:hypothetical protein
VTGFSDQFLSYLQPEADTTKRAITSGLTVLDTNVLLNIYRFAPIAREELLSVLEQMTDRLWIPHQVALEFFSNRFNAILENADAYNPVLEELGNLEQAYLATLPGKIAALANRTALEPDDKQALLDLLPGSFEQFKSLVESLREKHRVIGPSPNDPILARLRRILDGRVGSPFSEEDAAEARKEAASRIQDKRPPGYRDPGRHGDYFVWRQTLIEAKARAAEVLLLVTSDVKEDWYLIAKGKTIIPRPELADEAKDFAGSRLLMMTTDSFLYHAREYLQATVSAETIRQAERLPRLEIEALRQALQESEARLKALHTEMQAIEKSGEEIGERARWLNREERIRNNVLARAELQYSENPTAHNAHEMAMAREAYEQLEAMRTQANAERLTWVDQTEVIKAALAREENNALDTAYRLEKHLDSQV